jgi:hypothetical protein
VRNNGSVVEVSISIIFAGLVGAAQNYERKAKKANYDRAALNNTCL